jgi:hypothetical protein
MLPVQAFATSGSDQQSDDNNSLSAAGSTEVFVNTAEFATLEEAAEAGVVASVPLDEDAYCVDSILIVYEVAEHLQAVPQSMPL